MSAATKMKRRPPERQVAGTNPQPERSFVACVLLAGYESDMQLVDAALEIVRPADIEDLDLRNILQVVCDLRAQGEPAIEETINDLRAARGQLEERGADISVLINHCTNSMFIETYARQVVKNSIERSFRGLSEGIRTGMLTLSEVRARTCELIERRETIDTGRDRYAVQSARELMAMDLPETVWIVPEVFAEGLTLFAGRPKAGKSTTNLSVCIAAASGGKVFGRIQAQRCGVLYLALEDNPKRMQKRLGRMLRASGLDFAPENLDIVYAWPAIGAGGIERLEKYLDEHPECLLIIVDTHKGIKPTPVYRKTRILYDEDYDSLLPLHELANRRGVAIVATMHLRKPVGVGDPFDEINGSTGVTAVADNMVVLRRAGDETTLYRRGRDYEDDEEWALKGDPTTLTWELLGAAKEVRQSEALLTVYETLPRTESEAIKVGEIASRLGKTSTSERSGVRMLVKRAVDRGDPHIVRTANDDYWYRESGESKESVTGVTALQHLQRTPVTTLTPVTL